MIERVSFTNFKSLRKTEIALGRFMVIVGPNGSGKTSILDGLHYLAQTTQRALGLILKGVFSPLNLITRDAKEPMELSLSGRFRGVEAGVKIVVKRAEKLSASTPQEWSAMVVRQWGDVEEQTSETREGARDVSGPKPKTAPVPARSTVPTPRGPQKREVAQLARELGSARKLRLDVERLAAPSYSDEEMPRLGIDGEGLASVLADLAGRAPESFQSIQDAAHQVVPTLERIRTRRAKVARHEQQEIRIDDKPITHTTERPYWGQQLVLDFKGAPDVPAPLASEGTLLVIGLLTALYTEPRPRLLLLDDIDKALHPRAQGELVAQLRKVLAMDPELQIIATSHSPYLLDHFEPEEVLVTALRPDGSTACAPLTEHPDFERWKSTTRTGELWSFVGEDWVTKRANDATDRP
ncbi:AAA family ATPase [Polyangium sorediatum]|uniref:AAA family ATPase n=1 Tax=Polyangium sorediatum TaxID=889274 RepID=A0ABT6P166_9BACT|nr:ATP-binding protein [Polyangium sorediatum]MDI1434000.1 AAA family ATPase [Polyangium sorediatum]